MSKTYRIMTPIAWGGSDDNETLDDVLLAISTAAPTSFLRRSNHRSGGWPVYEIIFSAEDLESLCGLMDLEKEDFIAVE